MPSLTGWARSVPRMVKGQELDFHATFPIDECQRLLSVRTTPPLNSTLHGDDWRRVERLRSEGILLQGRISSRAFDVYCLEKLTGLRGNLWRPHYIGRFEPCSKGTVIDGKLGVQTLPKAWTLFMCIVLLLFVITAVVTGTVFLAIFTCCFFLLVGILLPGFCLFMARHEWDELPATLRDIFQAS